MSILTFAKFTTSTRTDITFQASAKELRTITMCSAVTLDSRFDNSSIKLFGNVYCAKTLCSGIFRVHKKISQSLDRSEYQCPQVRNSPIEEQTNSFFLKFSQGVYAFEETKNSNQNVLAHVYCPTCPNETCVYISTNRKSSFYHCKMRKACSHVLNFTLKAQKPTFVLFDGDGTHCFAKK